MNAIRNFIFTLIFTMTGVTMATPAQAQAQSFAPTTTGVLVIVTAKQGVTREQIMNVMPREVRATVKLYLDGKIREWYSRGDGRGAVFLVDAKDVAEAHALIDDLPLGKEGLVDHEYIAVGPLMPLRGLIGPPPSDK